MTRFEKDFFDYDGMYLKYGAHEKRFVARFKRRSDKTGFLAFLIKNFTVEEYFARMDAGETPVSILESRGYVSATVKKLLKSVGYEPTAAGKDAYLASLFTSRGF